VSRHIAQRVVIEIAERLLGGMERLDERVGRLPRRRMRVSTMLQRLSSLGADGLGSATDMPTPTK
jgi:hypothetical protein